MATYVLVHGAWHGGWCWRPVAERLRAAGHEVHTPTLTGLGERAHLLAREVGLHTHVEDVVALFRFEGLSDAILVGHSYAGVVVSAVAERVPEQIGRLVYLDAVVARDGESVFDTSPEFREKVMGSSTDGWTSPPFSAKWLGVTDPQDAAWVESRTTPMPLACFEEPVHLGRPEAAAIPRSYVFCTRWSFGETAAACRAAGWDCHELDTGHDAMVTEPQGLTAILLSLL
jgi:pimeloyl-ACP methyl ester carboxylesterase